MSQELKIPTWRERLAHLDKPTDFAEAQAAKMEAADLRRYIRELERAQHAGEAAFGLTPEQIGGLLDAGLKPDEIGGEPGVQQERVSELLQWFARFMTGRANPKWLASHACELAYYIASNGMNRAIDVSAIQKAAYVEGVNIKPDERALLERIGAAAPQPAAVPEGYVLVPAKPTIAMCIRGAAGADNEINGQAAAQVYAAMLAAAPVASVQQGREGE